MVRALLIAAALLALPAAAHEKRAVRTAAGTVRAAPGGVELDVLVGLRFAGPRAAAFRARFDVDRSGQLEAGESALAGDALAPEAIGGLFARFDGAARPPAKAEARARVDREGAVEVAVLLSWPAAQAEVIELAARAGRDRPGAPAPVAHLSALPPLALVVGESKPAGRVGPTPILPGAPGLTVRVVRMAERAP